MYQPVEVKKSGCYATKGEDHDILDWHIGTRGDLIGVYSEPLDFVAGNEPIPKFLFDPVRRRRIFPQF
jgi:hypothetical protein